MENPYALLNLANVRHQATLQAAEIEWVYRQVKGNRPGFFQQIGAPLWTVTHRLWDQIQPTLTSLAL